MDENSLFDKSNLLERLDRHLDWIKSCDTKSSIVITGIGVFLTIFTAEHSMNMLKTILSQTLTNLNFSNFLYLSLFFFSFSILIYGTYCLVRVLIPRLSKDNLAYEGIQNDSLYFFETIAKNTFSEFKDKITHSNQEDELNDILSQIYVNAKICTIKYFYFSKGIRFSFLGIAGVIILFLIGAILVKLGGFNS